MFTKAGETAVIIGKIVPSDSKFCTDADAFDINIQVTGEDGATDWVRLEFSRNYGKGNFRDRTQAQISKDTLSKLGYDDDDLTPLFVENHPLIGKTTHVMVKESKPNDEGKVFFNASYFMTGGKEPEAIAIDAVKSRMAALFGSQADAPAAQNPSVAQVVLERLSPPALIAPSPFGGAASKPNPFTKRA